MNKLDKISHQLLCDLEGVSSLDYVKLKDVKLDLIKEALAQYKSNETMDPELKQWYLEKFEIFWKKYGKKVGRTPALKKWMKLKKDEVDMILDTVDHFVRVNSDLQFRPHPVTYLNQKRYEDELPDKWVPGTRTRPKVVNEWPAR